MIPFNIFCKNLVTLLVIILCNEEKKVIYFWQHIEKTLPLDFFLRILWIERREKCVRRWKLRFISSLFPKLLSLSASCCPISMNDITFPSFSISMLSYFRPCSHARARDAYHFRIHFFWPYAILITNQNFEWSCMSTASILDSVSRDQEIYCSSYPMEKQKRQQKYADFVILYDDERNIIDVYVAKKPLKAFIVLPLLFPQYRSLLVCITHASIFFVLSFHLSSSSRVLCDNFDQNPASWLMTFYTLLSIIFTGNVMSAVFPKPYFLVIRWRCNSYFIFLKKMIPRADNLRLITVWPKNYYGGTPKIDKFTTRYETDRIKLHLFYHAVIIVWEYNWTLW